MSGSGGRRAIVCVLFAAAIGAVTHAAAAFELKQDSHGQPLHWGAAEVSYVIDPSVEKRISGGSAAVTSAVGVWSSAGGAPALSTSVGPGGAQPGLDGQNSVILAPDGYAPAGQALAVTVTSYDDDTGAIVDSDIVINGVYTFAVLDASERAASGTKSISTDGAANADGSNWFDPVRHRPRGVPRSGPHVGVGGRGRGSIRADVRIYDARRRVNPCAVERRHSWGDRRLPSSCGPGPRRGLRTVERRRIADASWGRVGRDARGGRGRAASGVATAGANRRARRRSGSDGSTRLAGLAGPRPLGDGDARRRRRARREPIDLEPWGIVRDHARAGPLRVPA